MKDLTAMQLPEPLTYLQIATGERGKASLLLEPLHLPPLVYMELGCTINGKFVRG